MAGDAEPISGNRAPGAVLLLIGLGLLGWGLIMDPSVPSYSSGSIYDLGPSRINNNGLLNDKLILCVSGAAFLVSGNVLLAASGIIDAIGRLRTASRVSTSDQTAPYPPHPTNTGNAEQVFQQEDSSEADGSGPSPSAGQPLMPSKGQSRLKY